MQYVYTKLPEAFRKSILQYSTRTHRHFILEVNFRGRGRLRLSVGWNYLIWSLFWQMLVAEHFCNPTCSIALITLSCKIIVMKSLFCCVFTVYVYYFCRFWISKYGLEFKKDVKLVSLLNQFSEIVDCKGDKSVIDNSNMWVQNYLLYLML